MAEPTDTKPRAKPLLIDPENTYFSLGKIVLAVGASGSGLVWADRITQQLDAIDHKVEALSLDVRRLPNSRDFNAWVREFRALNPELQIPPFDAPNGQ